jgi:hypothetical protein
MSVRLLLLLLATVLLACTRTPRRPDVVVRGVYHWSNTEGLYDGQEQFVATHHVQLLLWKVLDIDWNEANEAHPVSMVRSPFQKNEWGHGGERSKRMMNVELVPVVFITNRTMLNCDTTQLLVFADKLQRKLVQLCGLSYNEVQFDCDWTARSKENYFAFLRLMRTRLNRRLSATVRLHQFKDPEGTGVPPVDRGMLMLYNVEDVKTYGPRNSIFNEEAAKPYLSGADHYPLPLDVALPAYSWLVHYRNGRFVRIENGDLVDGIDTLDQFKRGPDGIFTVQQETESWWGEALHIGDQLKPERMDSTTIAQAVELARTAVNNDTVRVAFFDLPDGPRRGITHTTYEHAWEAFR